MEEGETRIEANEFAFQKAAVNDTARNLQAELIQFQNKQIVQMQEVIRTFAKTIKKGDGVGMREAAHDINESLDKLHLAIRCKITGEPGLLVVDSSREIPRFRIRLSHQSVRLTSGAYTLDELELVLIPDTSKSHTPRLSRSIGR